MLRMGMIGGGPGSFIGAIHRQAAALDQQIRLVCGAFSRDAEKSMQAGQNLSLDTSRVYGSYKEMFRRELELPVAERMEFVSIVTPNHEHFEPARLALESGFPVIIDKPVTFSLEEAVKLQSVVEKSALPFCITHTYAGYPMIKEAKEQVLAGKFGKIRKVFVEYPQGWLSQPIETKGNIQASWRTDPQRSGISGAMGDIGSHAFHLAEYVTGLQVTEVFADLHQVVEGRPIDDDGAVLLKFNEGASGLLFATQVAAGEENNLRLRIYGEKGGLEWNHREPNSLWIKWPDRPAETWRAGSAYLSARAQFNCRTPAGHPEGYIEAFGNHYRNFALVLKSRMANETPPPFALDFPGIDEGVRIMKFIEKTVQSSREKKWLPL
jgi:predicted dehydrogenase